MADILKIEEFRDRIKGAMAECLVDGCNKRFHSIIPHLKEVHGMSAKAYQNKYTNKVRMNSPIISELLKRIERNPQSQDLFEAHVDLYTYNPDMKLASLDEGGKAWRQRFGEVPDNMQFLVPKIDSFFEFTDNAPEIVDALLHCKNVLITGPTGSGKTQEILQVMARMGIPKIRANMNGDVTARNFLGAKEGDPEKGTYFKYGDLPRAMGYSDGLASVPSLGIPLIVDEVDYTPPHIASTLNSPAEEGERSLHLMETGETFTARPGFTILATANTGGKGDDNGQFTGTEVLNTAFLDRFSVRLNGDYLEPNLEESMISRRFPKESHQEVAKMVQMANEIRNAFTKGELALTMSTRKLIEYFDQKMRKSHERALNMTLMNWFSSREDYQVVSEILKRLNVIHTPSSVRFK